jgi:solute carrier family 45 protein 1/2/4
MRSSWGKRKPFIVFGTIVLIIALMSIAWGDSIARCLTTTDESYRIVLVAVILTSTFVLWIAAQAVQVGLRALVSDGCSSAEQVKSSAWAGCYSHFAAVVGNLTAYIDGSYAKQPVMRGFKSMSILASCCVACTVFVSCIAAREHTPQTSSRRIHRSTSFREIWKLLSRTSPQIRNICFVQILAWGGWFPFLFHTEK